MRSLSIGNYRVGCLPGVLSGDSHRRIRLGESGFRWYDSGTTQRLLPRTLFRVTRAPVQVRLASQVFGEEIP